MLHLIIGPMFSGKSSELLRVLTRAHLAHKKVILIRPEIDDRDIITHDFIQPKFPVIKTQKIFSPETLKYDIIGIDECQFFNNVINDVNRLIDEYQKTVYIAGLNCSSEQKPFQVTMDCIPFAETITKLNAVCSICGSDYGTFTYYTAGKKSADILVGDKDKYTTLCRECYNGQRR